jgi:hypothetical protein
MLVLVARYTWILISLSLWVSISLESTYIELTSVKDSAIFNLDLCGKRVEITNLANGKTVTATVADECPTCDNSKSIDMSVATFEAIALKSVGLILIEWRYVE